MIRTDTTRFILILISIVLAAGAASARPAYQPGAAGEAVDSSGEIEGAAYRIQIPADWNGNLLVYTHGYKARGAQWIPLHQSYSTTFLSRGFAIAESGYSRQGWAVEEALQDTERLRKYFSKEYGKPDSTFVAGFSMGGLITLATIESYPDFYDGALPMCGPLAPAFYYFKEFMFDRLVMFEGLFSEALPAESKPVIEAESLPAQVVAQALASDTTLAAEICSRWSIRQRDLPGMIAMFHFLYKELADRAGGNPFDNTNTIYAEVFPVKGLNGKVPRYSAEPAAMEYLIKYYTPSGKIKDPVLALHTTYDAGVPPCIPCYYFRTASMVDTNDLFVQKYVEADGHCNFTPAQVGRVFDELRGWVSTGIKPEPGLVE